MSTRETAVTINPMFARPGEDTLVDRFRLPNGQMMPETAYQIVHDEVMLDGNARLNLATFVGTWMDTHAVRLYAETVDKNMIDKDEYPQTAAIEDRCWKILADLWHAPEPTRTAGTSTVGSSEACMLAGLALKRRWQEKRRAAGLPADRPNLVMSSAVQVVWEKFCNYWDVEPRCVPITEEHRTLNGSTLRGRVDENTIGVVAIMGVTYTGMYEPVAQIARALDDLQRDTGLDVPVHVDGASGAMVAPFLQPELEWDFRLERVHSINTSGHKYGLVYPGLGWVVWRTREHLPEDLVFRVSYLGGEMPTFALNFSRPGAQVLLQYYQFLRLGREGYRAVQGASRDTARYLADGVASIDAFELWNDGSDIPVFAWRLAPGAGENWSLYDLSDRLRMKGWLVPAYPMPDDLSDTTVQRIVVRNGLGLDLAESLLADIREETAYLERLTAPLPSGRPRTAFNHGGRAPGGGTAGRKPPPREGRAAPAGSGGGAGTAPAGPARRS
ncbi:glutamate decarboxylase [Streptomyces sp. HB2AG]|uniref:glutamate decarboxylase n=1 Tax=Streptomyces sp. HB2AG TaxID=2983400 RepID=UPI002E7C43D9|nr:glutamate decarboxylase [Streptomyces sp. HB2AG]